MQMAFEKNFQEEEPVELNKKDPKEFPIIKFEKKFFQGALNEEFERVFILHLFIKHNKELNLEEKQELCARQREYMKSLLSKFLSTQDP